MRIIKFRAWDKKNRKFTYCNFLITDDVTNFGKGNWFLEDLQQFTGLKDKKGKGIYEGDIVEFRGVGQIKWEEGGARFMVFWKDKRFDNLSSGWAKKYEVIGNIYENKDLLK